MRLIIDHMSQNGYAADDFKLKVGIFGAEPWADGMQHIEESLNIKALDIYGLTEIMDLVYMECLEQNGLHIWRTHSSGFADENYNRC